VALDERYRVQAEILKALAHPARLAMIEALAGGEKCVNELREVVDLDMSTVSKHLAILRHVGIVTDQKRGNQVFYRLRTPCVLNFFQCIIDVQKSVQARFSV